MTDLLSDLELIRDAALAAGKLALEHREAGLKVWSKEGGSPVTSADLAVDQLLRDALLSARPDYGWLSEETADSAERLTKKRIAQQLVHRQVGAGDGRAALLGPDLQPRLAMLERQLARGQGRVADQFEVGQKVGHFPAMATASNIREGLLKEPRNSRSDPRTSRA